jgi:hypothetical protein
LLRALSAFPLPAGHKEMGRLVLGASVEEFWSLFHGSGCKYGFDNYYTHRGYKKITLTQDWTDRIDESFLKQGFSENGS